jgi:thiazole synthase
MRVVINGENREISSSLSVAALLRDLGLDARKIALEHNLEIVPRSAYDQTVVADGDRLEIVHFIGGGDAKGDSDSDSDDDSWTVAGQKMHSRLIVGTGKYQSYDENFRAVEAAGAEMVTVAVRRVNVTDPDKEMLVDHIDPKKFIYLPNTAGCFTGEEAVRTLRLAREAGGWDLVKLEVLGDQQTLYPNMPETQRAAEMLIKEGFQVMVYCSDDPIQARVLEEIGCCAIMPLGAPIGSGLGVQNPVNIRVIIENAKVPVIVDAGVGTASDAAIAMELGCAGVLMNTAIAEAKDPIRMARAMKHAVIAGREAYLAGRMAKKMYADPSSPLAGLI